MKQQRVFWGSIKLDQDMQVFLWLPKPSLLSVFHITSHGTSIAEAEEGATTECIRTAAAADSHVLDFLDSSHTGGPHVKGNHLVNSGNEAQRHEKHHSIHFLPLIQFKVRGVPMHNANFAKQEHT